MQILKPIIEGPAIISGSLEVSGSLTIIENLNVVGELQGTATTASYISLANVDGFTQVSSSIEQRITSQELFSSSLSVEVSYDNILNLPSGIVSGSSQIDYNSLQNIPSGIVSGSSQISYTELSNIPSGIISSSAQITSLTSYTETFTSQTAVTASHDLGTKNVTVSVYDSNDFMIFPTSIKTHDTNNVYVQFNTSRSGRIVITK